MTAQLHFALATEDELSESIGIRLIHEIANASVGLKLRRGGNGYLRSSMSKFSQISQNTPLLIITDLDNKPCASSLIADWKQGVTFSTGMVFRVAVREIESWILADRAGLADLFNLNENKIPCDPDSLADPKKALLDLAGLAPRSIRNLLVKKQGAIASQGLGYNSILCNFVSSKWDPARAATCSNSLHKARCRLQEVK